MFNQETNEYISEVLYENQYRIDTKQKTITVIDGISGYRIQYQYEVDPSTNVKRIVSFTEGYLDTLSDGITTMISYQNDGKKTVLTDSNLNYVELMARCMTSERHGRPVFYGAMITEGIVALIWAAAATYFYREHGMEENNASVIVDAITKDWLGAVGGVLAILGVIAAPITSGDTAFRSARLIVADFLKLEQKSMRRRLYICVPMFIVAIGLLLYSLRDKDGFDMIWRYFAWANQTLSVFTLWAITVYLARARKWYGLTLVPALFMTAVCSSYICIAPEGLGLSHWVSYVTGGLCTLIGAVWFIVWKKGIGYSYKK